MRKFNELVVFEGSTYEKSSPKYVYLNEGFMRDFERLNQHLSAFDGKKEAADSSPSKSRILYHDEELSSGMKIFRIMKNDGSYTSWFTSEQMAREANNLTEKDCKEVHTAQFVSHKIEPLPEVFEVKLQKGRIDGEFLCYVNLHPETNGNTCKRKIICFPDKSWDGPIKEGPAMVSVVREMQHYAFLSGKMLSL